MNKDSLSIPLLCLVVTFTLGLLFGIATGSRVTEDKCLESGALIIDNKVYECRVVAAVSKQQDQERQEEQ